MKTLLFIPLLLLSGLLLVTGGKTDELPPMPGGLEDNTIYDAPTAIASTEIVAFHCAFSTVDLVLPEGDSELADSLYTLTAEWKDGAVTGGYELRSGLTGDGSLQSFQAGRAFLDALQELVAKHDLPQYNGISRYTYGLPEFYGAELSITYASGESVCASDNQDCFLPLAAIQDLERLFRQQVDS